MNFPAITTFPEEGQRGEISFRGGLVMGLTNDNIEDGTKVNTQRNDDANTGQIWIRHHLNIAKLRPAFSFIMIMNCASFEHNH